MMRVFNGKAAADDYMSTHTLTYSTPEMMLKKFAYWLGDLVDVECTIEASKCPNEDGLHPKHRLPRMMLYLESKDIPFTAEREEVDETAFKPSGAITAFYDVKKLHPEKEGEARGERKAEKKGEESRFCFECGTKVSKGAKFCPQCGTDQEVSR